MSPTVIGILIAVAVTATIVITKLIFYAIANKAEDAIHNARMAKRQRDNAGSQSDNLADRYK